MSEARRILIVDDDDDVRDVVRVSLEEFGGWQTILAPSGFVGLQLAQTERPDAILIDISMPEMNGFELCEALQADLITRQIPVIVLTARVLARDRQRLTKLTIAGVITKPFDPLMVCQQVAEVLGWSRC